MSDLTTASPASPITNEHEQVLNSYESHCLKHNINLTPLRKEVLKHIIASAPVKAYHIIGEFKKNRTEQTTSPPLIYRTLDFLLKQGLIHKLEKLHTYVICKHPLADHSRCALFHCTTCQNTLEICGHDFHDFIKKSETENNIQIDKSSLELYGTCSSCSTRSTRSKNQPTDDPPI